MIKILGHQGIKLFFECGSKAGIQALNASKLARQLSLLNSVNSSDEMNVLGWRFHPPGHDLNNLYAIWIDQNWRLTYRYDGEYIA